MERLPEVHQLGHRRSDGKRYVGPRRTCRGMQARDIGKEAPVAQAHEMQTPARQGARWSVGRKLAAMTMLGVAGAATVAWVGRSGVEKVRAGLREQVATSSALRNHMDGDMMHEALLGDAYAVLVADTDGEREQIRSSVEEHAARFRADVAANRKLQLPADVKAALSEISEPLEAYIESAESVVDNALTDTEEARAALPALRDDFEALEQAQDEVSGLITEQAAAAEHDAGQDVNAAGTQIVLALGMSIVAMALVANVLSRRITKPIKASVRSLEALADKDLTTTLEVTSADETALMARALNSAVGSLSEAMAAIDGSSETLAAASEELLAISGQMAASAEETSSQSTVVSAAGEEVSASVQTVATAVEEMTASVREIAQSTTEAAAVAIEAVGLANDANAEVARLGEASTEIGDVVKVISSIAEQTNLLALNATIEAARAGDAGKGFAVVAHEVKELATETARATEDISRRIGTVQAQTQQAVGAIERIAEIVGRLGEYQQSIAGAVEEQSATTSEIGRSVGEAARGVSEIAENVSGVASAAQQTAEGAGSTQQAASDLGRVAAELKDLVGQFRY